MRRQANMPAPKCTKERCKKKNRLFLRRCMTRLRSEEGFTLAEQLISVIFIGLLCVVISAGIGAALAAHGSVSEVAGANQLLSRTMEEVSDELAFSRSANEDGTFESATTRSVVSLTSDTEGIKLSEVSTGTSYLIVPGADGLIPTFSQTPSYNKESNTWSYAIIIKKGTEELISKEMKVTRNMSAQ